MFGSEFLEKNTVFAVTHWPHDDRSVRQRQRVGIDSEKAWMEELNKTLRHNFGISGTVPAVFIDVRHDKTNEQEVQMFDREMDNLRQFTFNFFNEYPCTSLRPA